MIRIFLKGNIILMGVNFLVGVITARTIGPAGRGILALAVLWPSMLVWLVNCNLPVAVSYFMPQMPEASKRRFISSTLLFACFAGFIAAVALYLAAPHLFTGEAAPYLPCIRCYLLLTPLSAVLELAFNLLLAIQDNHYWAGVRVVQPSVMGAGVLLLARFHSITVPWMLFLYALSGGLMCLLVLARIRRLVGIGRPGELRLFGQAISYGLKSNIGTVAGSLSLRLDQLLIGSFVGPGPLGIYTVAVNYVSLLSPVMSATTAGLMRHLSGLKEQDRKVAVIDMMRKSSFLLAAGSIGLLALVSLLPYIYGKAFAPAVLMSVILIPGTFLYGIAGIVERSILPFGQPLKATMAEVAGLIVTLLALLLLLPAYGAYGAAVASTLSYGTVWIVATFILSNVMQVSMMTLLTPLYLGGAVSMYLKPLYMRHFAKKAVI